MDTLELIPDAEANTPLVANGAHTPVLAEVKPLVTVRAPVGLTLALLATVGTIASSTRAAHRTTALNAQTPVVASESRHGDGTPGTNIMYVSPCWAAWVLGL